MVRVGELAFVYEDGGLTQYFYTIGDERAQRKAAQEPDREAEPGTKRTYKGSPPATTCCFRTVSPTLLGLICGT